MEQLVTIELFGQTFKFKSENDPSEAKEIINFLVNEVTKLEAQYSKESSNITKQTILVLTALNISNEYFGVKRSYHGLLQNLSERSAKLIKELDANLD